MRLNRVMIAAPKSGSGKTTIICGLLQLLKEQGEEVISCKCGPDYIDPMFHQQVIGIPSKNLDTFFTGEEETRNLLLRGRKEGELVLMEGVMGLYDGLGGICKEGSSYHLAEVTKTPIILVVDAKGMGRSLIPLLAGFLAYDERKLIKGVIFNRMSRGYYETIAPLVEKELNLSVVGYFPEEKELTLKSRHLGLKLPHEVEGLRVQLERTARRLQETLSLHRIREIAAQAEELERPAGAGEADALPGGEEAGEGKAFSTGEEARAGEKFSSGEETGEGVNFPTGEETREGVNFPSGEEAGAVANFSSGEEAGGGETPVIAVARDEAFCFYYEDNLFLLQEYGARLAYFSPLHDEELPAGCGGILLGGGYPELYAEKLSRNQTMRSSIRQAIEQGMPVVAECGGFMYLHSTLRDKEGQAWPMVGTIDADCHYTGKLVRFGYIEVEEVQAGFLPAGERIRGHEFHYFDSMMNGEGCRAIKPVTGKSYLCVLTGENYWLGFPHLYYPSNPAFAKGFVQKVRRYHIHGAFAPLFYQ